MRGKNQLANQLDLKNVLQYLNELDIKWPLGVNTLFMILKIMFME